LAVPVILALYLFWKIYSWFMYPDHKPLYVKIKDIDVYAGMRDGWNIGGAVQKGQEKRTVVHYLKSFYHLFF
jgi:amino acid transporter